VALVARGFRGRRAVLLRPCSRCGSQRNCLLGARSDGGRRDGRWHRNPPTTPRHTIAWAFAAISLALFLAGDYVYADLAASQAFVPFPSVADWLFLAMYPVLALGIAIIVSRLAPHRSWKVVGLGVAVALTAAGALYFLYMGEYIAEPIFDTKMRAAAVAYPVLDAVMFGVAASLLVIARRQSPSLVMVALGLVSMVVGNVIYNVQSIDGSFGSGGLADFPAMSEADRSSIEPSTQV
jgi:hypothetical protein|tara:strand:- start:9908 stop:10618 length:711 start_codon:yes stop_codon:yes gene_type:complete